ncbi:MAG: EAL domain-containing protein [Gammaproteobacteria bacterium]|nr:EAL domain-containing protein [Gammaproteobacteria bacterium]
MKKRTHAVSARLNQMVFAATFMVAAAAFLLFWGIEWLFFDPGTLNYQRFFTYLTIVVVLSLVVRLHAHIIWKRVLKLIESPLMKLSESFSHVTEHNDYSHRLAPPDSSDFTEIYDRFNEAIQHMQHRETYLKEQRGALKEKLIEAQHELREQRRRLKQEVNKRRRAQAEMLKLSSALTHSADAVMVTNTDGIIEYVNPAFESITLYDRHEVIGKTPDILRSEEQDTSAYKEMWETILKGDVFRCELINQRKDGSHYHEEKTITPLKDGQGKITHFIATGVDISERIRAQEKLEYMAHHDAVTGLPNRVLLLDRVQQALHRAQRDGVNVAVLFIDLDGFKAINDTVGHHFGDRLLSEVASRLQNTVREEDTVARLGGDEFAVVLEGMSTMHDIGKVSRKIIRDLAAPFILDGRELYVTGSIGVSRYPTDGYDVHTLLRKSDSAMYRAKQVGKNTYRFYSEVEGEEDTARLQLEQQLRRAVERDEFIVYYQPQVSIDTSEVVGVEALLRWNHPDHGIIEPGRFIPLLEETGLIIDVGEWVLREVCRHAAGWQRMGLPQLRIAVNLSSRQFEKRDLVGDIARALDESGLEPHRLNIEITEGTLATRIDHTIRTLDKLNALGITISVDDFGVGYSSLNYLKRFPIHKLKIDQSFVRDVTTDSNDAEIASAIIALAHKLNLDVIAEGVETLEQLFFLSRQGCHEVQGHLMSKPLSNKEFIRWIADNHRIRVKRAANM